MHEGSYLEDVMVLRGGFLRDNRPLYCTPYDYSGAMEVQMFVLRVFYWGLFTRIQVVTIRSA
jgi:hypothetical protein